METTGKLFKKMDAQQITERFRKREMVVELTDNPKYPQFVLFQLTGDRCEVLDGFEVGQQLKLEFDLRGREWTSPKGEVRYFNSLEVWRLESAGQTQEVGFDEPPPPNEPPPGFDDLPF